MNKVFKQLKIMTMDKLIKIRDVINEYLVANVSQRQNEIIRLAQKNHFGTSKVGLVRALRLIEDDMSLMEAKLEIERLFYFDEYYNPIKKGVIMETIVNTMLNFIQSVLWKLGKRSLWFRVEENGKRRIETNYPEYATIRHYKKHVNKDKFSFKWFVK